ncbi:MAG: hypothetical protein KF762_04235 [Acidobacteria bacterium]|nr:hypothetical protein [Acidobacteriota bacterium]
MSNIQYYPGAIDPSGCISNGWNLIKPKYWMYFAISLLTWVIVSCIPCVNYILMGPVLAGVYYTLLRDMRGESVDFGMMFKGFEKFLPALVVGLVQSIPGIIWQIIDTTMNISTIFIQQGTGSLGGGNFFQETSAPGLAEGISAVYFILAAVFLIVTVVWSISFAFAIPLIAEHNIGPVEALTLSAKAAWSNVGGVIVTSILLGLIALLGVLALCIGVFFVLPLFWAAWAFAYRQVFPAIDTDNFRMEPPSPQEYGSSFGQGME